MSNCSSTVNYQNILSDFQLTQFVSGPSRVTELSSTLIDHILCTSSILVLDVKQAIGLSEHRVQILVLNIVVQRPPNSFCWARPFRKCSWSSVRDCISSAPWSVMEMYDDPDDMWGFFIHIITSCLDKFAPLQKCFVSILDVILLGFLLKSCLLSVKNREPSILLRSLATIMM